MISGLTNVVVCCGFGFLWVGWFGDVDLSDVCLLVLSCLFARSGFCGRFFVDFSLVVVLN